jgi:glycosyltransferase involved in cell wall biosynthesis
MTNNLKKYPLVSIIMNCYNGEKYLSDAIKSVLKQNYKNFEVIFWDNQSQDNSAYIYKSFKDRRLKYYYAKKNTTLYEARNLAVKKCKGKFVAFLDTDDMWLKDKLSSQVKKIQNKKICLVYSNYYILNHFINLKKIAYKSKLPEGIIYKDLLKKYFLGIGTVLIKKDFFKKNFFFNKKFNIIGDFDFITRLSKNCYFASIQRPLSIYRIHNESFSNKNYEMHINELKFWVKKEKFLDESLKFFVIQKILYMQVIVNILKKNYILSLKMLQQVNSPKIRIKILIFLLIPNFILKKLKNHFS